MNKHIDNDNSMNINKNNNINNINDKNNINKINKIINKSIKYSNSDNNKSNILSNSNNTKTTTLTATNTNNKNKNNIISQNSFNSQDYDDNDFEVIASKPIISNSNENLNIIKKHIDNLKFSDNYENNDSDFEGFINDDDDNYADVDASNYINLKKQTSSRELNIIKDPNQVWVVDAATQTDTEKFKIIRPRTASSGSGLTKKSISYKLRPKSAAEIAQANTSFITRPISVKKPRAKPIKYKQPPPKPQSAISRSQMESMVIRLNKSANFSKTSKEVSSLLSDCANCIFMPTVSKSTETLHLPSFSKRVDLQIQNFNKFKNESKVPPLDKECTFRPQLNDINTKNMPTSGFITRINSDTLRRQNTARLNAEKQLYSFQPDIPIYKNDSKETFLERQAREETNQMKKLQRIAEIQRLVTDCTFQPYIRPEVANLNLGDFLKRMENDKAERYDKRHEKIREQERKEAKMRRRPKTARR